MTLVAAHAAPSVLHARLERSVPAADETLREPLDTLRLEFSARVTLDLTRLTLIQPGGDSLQLTPYSPGDDGLLIVAAAPAFRIGAHVLHWRTTSADGHVLEGDIPFVVAAAAAAPDAELPAQDTTAWPIAPDAPVTGGDAPSVHEAPADLSLILPLLRALGTIMLLVLAGGLLYTVRAPGQLGGLQRLLVALALATPFAIVSELIAWTAHVTGTFDLPSALQLATGRVLLARVLLAAAALALWVGLKRPGMASLLALIAAGAGGALGHAAAILPVVSIPLRAVHIVAVAVWSGALVALVSALRTNAVAQPFVRGISRTALWSFIVVAITGLVQALVLLGGVAPLLNTSYGRVVLVKVSGLIALAAFGLHHRRLIDRLDTAGAPDVLRASTTREILLFVGIIVVSAALAFTPLPD